MRVTAAAWRAAVILWAGLAPAPQSLAGTDEEPAIVVVREHLGAGRYKDAESGARAALTRIDARDGPDSAAAAAVLDLLVEALWRGNARAEDAQALADRVVALKTRQHGADHPEVAKSLHNSANLLAERGEHRAAQETLERVLRIREAAFGAEDLAVAGVLGDLALEVSANGSYPRARTLFERALAIREQRLSPDDLSIATVLNNLGALLKDMGRYGEAEPRLRRSLAIREKGLGPNHLLVASTLNNLGYLEIERGRYEEARRIYDRVIAINEQAYAAPNAEVARTITNVAIATAQGGDYEASRQLFVRALDTMEKALGPRHPDVASAMNNLATIDQRIGDLTSARALHERALALRKEVLPPDHRDLAESFNNLGTVLRAIGDYRSARLLYDRALAIRENAYGARHRAVASTLNNLGAVARDLGQQADAERFYRRSLAILEEAVGANHLLVAQVLTNLAPVLHDLRQTDAAEAALRRSLSIYETSYGANHPLAAAAHENLAFNFHQRGNHAQAQAEYERAFTIRSVSLGASHPELGQGLVGLATELFEQRQYQEAFRIAALAESNSLEHVRATAATLPERQALTLAATRATGLDLAIAIAIADPGAVPDAAARAFDLLVRSRALVLDEMAARQREQHTSLDGGVERARLLVASARRRLANTLVRSASASVASYRAELEQVRAEYEAAERGLAEQYAPFRRQRARARATLSEVVAALPTRSTLIAYTRYRPQPVAASARDTSRYAAFVVQPDGAVRLVPLESAPRVDTMVETWRTAVTRTAPTRAGEHAARAAGRTLRRTIWDPVADRLPESGIVLVVPDGSLNIVSLAALPDDRSGYLVESDAQVHYLSAERDLVPIDSTTGGGDRSGGLLALGGAAFGPIAAPAAQPPRRAATAAAQSRGECAALGSVSFEPLPGTAREAAAVVAMWRQAGRGGGSASDGPSADVSHLAGRGATEAAFKQQAPGRHILHLATHGFVLSENCGNSTPQARGVGGIVPQSPSSAMGNPLRLSGLALAGANRRRAASANAEDGIVTAEEIVSLDLSSTSWAVLSACDTGLGEIRAGEGVLGLRRAFAVAGARTTVMSLWSVDDRAALEWMTALYRARLIDGKSTVESVKRASLSTLRARRARHLNTHPFYWAGFVAAGDWR